VPVQVDIPYRKSIVVAEEGYSIGEWKDGVRFITRISESLGSKIKVEVESGD